MSIFNNKFKIIRAVEMWQQAGAYYVRIQAMAKKHHITLRQEFDEHDTPETKYIVITDRDFPIATARIYPLEEGKIMLGRVVVLHAWVSERWLSVPVRNGQRNLASKKLHWKVGIIRSNSMKSSGTGLQGKQWKEKPSVASRWRKHCNPRCICSAGKE